MTGASVVRHLAAYCLIKGQMRNSGQRALRGVALGRRNWTFANSDAGGRRVAAVYSLH